MPASVSEAMTVRYLTFAAWLLLIPALLLTGFLPAAGNARLYGKLQDQYVNEARTGVSDEDRYRINECLAAYLRGDREDIDIRAAVYGEEQAAFNETEILHMKDVRALFDIARTVRAVLLLCGSALLAVPAVKRLRCVWHGFLAAAGVYLAALLGLGAWAVSDFTRAFLWFHEVLFSNELWLLNPATDLMIRMLPEAFFADIAAVCVIAMAAVTALAGAAAWMIFGRNGNR